jgi:hypothetical protein
MYSCKLVRRPFGTAAPRRRHRTYVQHRGDGRDGCVTPAAADLDQPLQAQLTVPALTMHSVESRRGRYRSTRSRDQSVTRRADARWEDEESTRPQWQSELTEDFLREQVRELARRDPDRWWEMTLPEARVALAKHMRRRPAELEHRQEVIKYVIAQVKQEQSAPARPSETADTATPCSDSGSGGGSGSSNSSEGESEVDDREGESELPNVTLEDLLVEKQQRDAVNIARQQAIDKHVAPYEARAAHCVIKATLADHGFPFIDEGIPGRRGGQKYRDMDVLLRKWLRMPR